MKNILQLIFGIVGTLVLLVGIVFVIGMANALYTRTVGVEQSDAQREAFVSTRAFNVSSTQQLARYKLEYDRAESSVEKNAILSTVRHQFSELDSRNIPNELASFLRQARGY